MHMSKRFLLTFLTAVVIFGATGVAVFIAKGYRFSLSENRISGTGIISITSEPSSASVYLDDHLTTATNATIADLSPKKYIVKIVKEGLIPWEREIEVKEGLISELKVTLFPAIPTVYPLTFTGVKNPVLSPDGSKLSYIVPSGKKAGIWVWTMINNQPISFARSAEPHQIAQTNNAIDFTNTQLKWSPDSKQVIATLKNSSDVVTNNYELNSDSFSSEPRDITALLSATLKGWEEDVVDKNAARIATIKNLSVRKIASDSAIVKWSPDETKFMYANKPTVSSKQQIPQKPETEEGIKFKVYDLDINKEYELGDARMYTWLPDSRHIVLVEENKISVVDFDGTNKAVIYAGNFQDNFVFAWPDSSRLVLISTFPTPTASEPNLYGINLK